MISGTDAVNLNQVTAEIDSIFGELDEILSSYDTSNIQVGNNTEASKIDIASTRQDILRSV